MTLKDQMILPQKKTQLQNKKHRLNKVNAMKYTSRTLVLILATTALAACQTTGTDTPKETPRTEQERIDSVIDKATKNAAKQGSVKANLLSLERVYKRDSENSDAAFAFAHGLRKAGYLSRAETVLKPFANDESSAPGIKTEMSMIKLALGSYDSAEKYAQAAIIQDPNDYHAYENLGIALDAKEMHPEAERAFRKGLEHWEGNPTGIMNNLALNLATQGFIDEAVEVLEQAKTISPDSVKIERNLRIIRTLNER